MMDWQGDVDVAAEGVSMLVSCVDDFHRKNSIAKTTSLDLSPIDGDVQTALRVAADAIGKLAAGFQEFSSHDDKRGLDAHLLCEELAEILAGLADGDEEIVLDGLADLAYVVAGRAARLDLPLGLALRSVHLSNMSKERQKTDEHGERVRDKGPNYVPPDIGGCIRDHREQAAMPHKFAELRGDEEVRVDECVFCGMSLLDTQKQRYKYDKVNCKGGRSCRS